MHMFSATVLPVGAQNETAVMGPPHVWMHIASADCKSLNLQRTSPRAGAIFMNRRPTPSTGSLKAGKN
eukprot:353747-Chlamydomonas_euryale.AAC.4